MLSQANSTPGVLFISNPTLSNKVFWATLVSFYQGRPWEEYACWINSLQRKLYALLALKRDADLMHELPLKHSPHCFVLPTGTHILLPAYTLAPCSTPSPGVPANESPTCLIFKVISWRSVLNCCLLVLSSISLFPSTVYEEGSVLKSL